jgi:hypothetical protein
VGHVAGIGERKSMYRVLMGKPEEKIPLGRPRCSRECNKMDLKTVECGGMDWIKLAQDRVRWQARVNVMMNLWIP